MTSMSALAIATAASVIARVVTASGQAEDKSVPVCLSKIPAGYRGRHAQATPQASALGPDGGGR